MTATRPQPVKYWLAHPLTAVAVLLLAAAAIWLSAPVLLAWVVLALAAGYAISGSV